MQTGKRLLDQSCSCSVLVYYLFVRVGSGRLALVRGGVAFMFSVTPRSLQSRVWLPRTWNFPRGTLCKDFLTTHNKATQSNITLATTPTSNNKLLLVLFSPQRRIPIILNFFMMSTDSEADEVCANCGKAAVDDIKLKICTACKLVNIAA